jgi:hypothetical protein
MERWVLELRVCTNVMVIIQNALAQIQLAAVKSISLIFERLLPKKRMNTTIRAEEKQCTYL